jgi:broad specificity phosphatase PhoE
MGIADESICYNTGMKITAVRHGETVENLNRIIQGQNLGHLSETGIKQVANLSSRLSAERFDAVYSSDLQRCVDTTRAILKNQPPLPVIYSAQIRELSFGEYQGKPSASIDWQSLPGTALTRKVDGGESWTDLRGRIVPFLNKLLLEHADDDVLIVTHGGPLRVMRSVFESLSLEDMIDVPLPNCAVYNFEMHTLLSTKLPKYKANLG